MRSFDLVDTVEDMCRDLSDRLKRLKSKPKQRSADEQGVINRAKELLMERNGFSEEEAHRFLQKHSMDSGNNMVDTAYMVLEMF